MQLHIEEEEIFMILDSQMTELGYALKSYRVRNNITQQELAERLGVSTNTIHLWETKICKPSMGSLLFANCRRGLEVI